jgi:predicted transcriptional regulator
MKLQFNQEIKTDILQALGDHHHATKLELMYHCMLCQESLDKYLQNLIEEGLISPSHGRRRFYMTAAGLKFLQSSKQQQKHHRQGQDIIDRDASSSTELALPSFNSSDIVTVCDHEEPRQNLMSSLFECAIHDTVGIG